MAENMMKEAVTSTARALKMEASGDFGEHPTSGLAVDNVVRQIIDKWPEMPKKVAHKTIEKYGLPNEAVASRLIWYNNGPWKRTIVYRDEVPHNFPKPHTDLLEQFIDYQVPIDKFSTLAEFDGSVIPERTKGEISARCDNEAANLLALNLTDEIVRGQTTVQEARRTYAEKILEFMQGQPNDYTTVLMVQRPSGKANDPDSVAPGGMIDEMMQKAKEMVGGS